MIISEIRINNVTDDLRPEVASIVAQASCVIDDLYRLQGIDIILTTTGFEIILPNLGRRCMDRRLNENTFFEPVYYEDVKTLNDTIVNQYLVYKYSIYKGEQIKGRDDE